MSRCSNGEECVRSVFTETNIRRAMWADEFDGNNNIRKRAVCVTPSFYARRVHD